MAELQERSRIYPDKSTPVFEQDWTIPNFIQVQNSKKQLVKQTLQFETNHLDDKATLKWKVGLQRNAAGFILMYIELLQKHEKISDVAAIWSVNYAKREHDGFYLLKEARFPREIEISHKLVLDLGWRYKQPDNSWRSICQNEEPLRLKICLSVQVRPSTWKESLNDFTLQSSVKLIDSFTKLSMSESTDLRIICSDNEELQVHQLILSARNQVFETMLLTDMSEKNTGVIKIDDISGATLKYFVHYFYTGELLPRWNEPEAIHEFVFATGKYQIFEVLQLLDNVLGTDLAPTCDTQLLILVSRLDLENAVVRVSRKLGKLFSRVEKGKDVLKLLGKSSSRMVYFTGV